MQKQELGFDNKEIGRGYLGLLVRLGLGLPYHSYRIGLGKDGRCEDSSVDPFIERHFRDYSSINYIIKNVSVILDAEIVRRGAKPDSFHYIDATGILENRLRIVNSVSGRDSEKTFDQLYDSFFNDERMPLIEEAIGIRMRYFDSSGFLKDQNLNKDVSFYYGNLAAEVSPRQDLI